MSSYQPSEFILGGDFLDDIGTTGDMRLPTPRNEVQAAPPPPNRTIQSRGPRYDSFRAQNSGFHHQSGQQQSNISRQPNPMYYNNAPRKGMQHQANNTMLNQMLNTATTTRGGYNWNNTTAAARANHPQQQRIRQHQVDSKVAMQSQQQQQAFRISNSQQQQMAAGKVFTPQQHQMLQQQQRIQQQQHIRQQQLVQQQQVLHQMRSSAPQQRAPSPMYQQSQRQHNFSTNSPLVPAMRPPTPVHVKCTPPPAQPSPKPQIAPKSRSNSPDVEIISTINVPDKPPSRGNFIVQPSPPPPAQPSPAVASRTHKNVADSDVEIIMTNIRPSNIIIKEMRTPPPNSIQLEKESRSSPVVAAPLRKIAPKSTVEPSVEPPPSPKPIAPLAPVEEEVDYGVPRLDCQLCSFNTSVIQHLDAHMYLAHQHRFKCKQCNLFLGSTQVAHFHWLLEHPQTAKQKPEILLLSLKPGPHFRHSQLLVCHFCHYIAPNWAKLEAHFLNTHPNSLEQVYVSYPLEGGGNLPPYLVSTTAFKKENTYSPPYVFECDFCEGTFLSSMLLRIHFMERHPDSMPKFSTIPNRDKLSIFDFNQRATGTGQFTCTKCLSTEDTEENFTIHQYLCQKGHYKCGCCEFWATSESDIKKHHSKKHKELYFSINVRRSLTRHVSLDTCSRYKCYYCTFFCFNSREMIYHCQRTHVKRQLPFKYYIFSSSKEEEPYLIEKSVFKCGHCDTFKPDVEEAAKEHSLKSHGEEKAIEVQLYKELTTKGMYTSPIWQLPSSCAFCKSKFLNLISCYHHHSLWHSAKFFPFPLDSLAQKPPEGAAASKRGRPKFKKKEEGLFPVVKKDSSDASALQKFNINKDVVIVLDKLNLLEADLGADLPSDDTEVQADSDSTVIQGEDSDYENNLVKAQSPVPDTSPKEESAILEDEKPDNNLKRKKSVTLTIAEESLNSIVGTVVAEESANEEQKQVPKTILKISKVNLTSPTAEWKVTTEEKKKQRTKKKISKKRKRSHSKDEDDNEEKAPKVIALDSTVSSQESLNHVVQEKAPLRKCRRGASLKFKNLNLKSLAPPPQSRHQIIAANFLVRKYQKMREDAVQLSRELALTLEKHIPNENNAEMQNSKNSDDSSSKVGGESPDEAPNSENLPTKEDGDKSLQLLPKGISLIPIQTSPKSSNEIQDCSAASDKVTAEDSESHESQSALLLPKPESVSEERKPEVPDNSPEGSKIDELEKMDVVDEDVAESRQEDSTDEEGPIPANTEPEPEISTSLMSQLKGIQIIPLTPALPTLPASITLTPTKSEPPVNNLQGLSIQIIPPVDFKPPATEEVATVVPTPIAEEEQPALSQPSGENKGKMLMFDSDMDDSDDEIFGKESGEVLPQEVKTDEEKAKDDNLLKQFPNLWNLQITRVEQTSAPQEVEKPESLPPSDALQITCMDDKNSKDSSNPGMESTDDLSSINTFSDSSQDSVGQFLDAGGKKEPRKSSKLTSSETAKKKLKLLENVRCTKALRSRSLDRAAKRVSIGSLKVLESKRRKRTPPSKPPASSKNNTKALDKILKQDNIVVSPSAFINTDISITQNSNAVSEEASSLGKSIPLSEVNPAKDREKNIQSSFYPPLHSSPLKAAQNPLPSKSNPSELACLYCSFKAPERHLDQHMMQKHHFHFKCTTCNMHFELPYLANHHHATERMPTAPHDILPFEGIQLEEIEDPNTEKCICEVCAAALNSYQSLRQHFKEKHPAQFIKFIREVSDGEVPSLLTEELYSCSSCDKFAGTYVEALCHCQTSHPGTQAIPTLHKAVEPSARYYSCDYCDFTTGSPKLIDAHWVILHPDRTAKSYSVDTESPECPSLINKNRKCKQCSFQAATADEVRAHFYLTHLGNFRCGSCTIWKRRAEDIEKHFAQSHPGENVTLLVRNKLAISSAIPAPLCDRLKCAYCIFFCFNLAEMKFHHGVLHAPRTLPLNYIHFDVKGTYKVVKKDLFRCTSCPDNGKMGFPEDLACHGRGHELEKITEDEEDFLEEATEGPLVKCQMCSFQGASLPILHHHHLCYHSQLPFNRQAYKPSK